MTNDFLIYDYLTFTTKIHTVSEVVELLGLSGVKFEPMNGFYGYKDKLFFDNISIMFNGRSGMGVCVEMSGKGCRAFETYGTGDYDSLFALILHNYDDDADKRKMNITRLDIAYDDFSGVLDLPLLCRETQKHNFVSRFKDWQVIYGNKGIAVNHGSKASTAFVRIYDKRLEQNMQDVVSHWVRCELQLRKDCAIGYLMLSGDINTKYFQVLNNYLRYVIEVVHTNPSMSEIAPYWLKFLQSAESKAVFHKPAQNYSFDKLFDYVNGQLSGAIQTYIDVIGVEQFLRDIHKSREGKALNQKYMTVKEQADANGDAILAYLKQNNLL